MALQEMREDVLELLSEFLVLVGKSGEPRQKQIAISC